MSESRADDNQRTHAADGSAGGFRRLGIWGCFGKIMGVGVGFMGVNGGVEPTWRLSPRGF